MIAMRTRLQAVTLGACAAVLGLPGAAALARSPDAQSGILRELSRPDPTQ